MANPGTHIPQGNVLHHRCQPKLQHPPPGPLERLPGGLPLPTPVDHPGHFHTNPLSTGAILWNPRGPCAKMQAEFILKPLPTPERPPTSSPRCLQSPFLPLSFLFTEPTPTWPSASPHPVCTSVSESVFATPVTCPAGVTVLFPSESLLSSHAGEASSAHSIQ